MGNLQLAVTAVVDGDVTHLATVLAANHFELRAAASNLPRLSVSRSALIKVLKEWRNGRCAADDVQQWASFVRRGYGPRKANGPLHPIDVEYDARDEDLISEIIGRLDEIGDMIDGCVSDEEQVEMLRILAA